MKRWTIAALASALLGACSTAPNGPRIAEAPPPPPVNNAVPYQWTLGNAPQAHKDMVAEFGKLGLRPGQYVWASSVPSEGETRIVIDRLTQMAYVYRGDTLVGAASISTARQGHITPLGEWKILEKRPFYRSKKYDNAPMPWMERFDEYGTAFHGGENPGYPASHGCIRMPVKFAEKVYTLTKVGTKVIIEG
ncbi:MAG TPA: L,D-transpeptidase family protein [Sphingomicrobium sp.]|nr:L,D-transpeptidase family protein [Sphingomicrobium sp.]